MTDVRWQEQSGDFHFETDLIRGRVVANGSQFTVAGLTWKPLDLVVDKGMALAPYRLLGRSSWMGEVREMNHTAALIDRAIVLSFPPTSHHQASLLISLRITGGDSIDCTADIVPHAHYPDYELLISSYFVEGFRPGAYLGPGVRGKSVEPEQVRPVENPAWRDMYVAFPRDERSANLLTDGRWQRGRHFTRFAPVRYYGLPLGFYSHAESPLDILVMSRPEDVFAVSMAYHSDDPADDVGQHRSLYLSLIGKDIFPGERVRTTYRMQLGAFGADQAMHLHQLDRFLSDNPPISHLDLDN